MVRVSLARQQLSDSGLMAVYSAANADGHSVENSGKVVLHVKNDSEEPVVVKVLSGYIRSGLKLADREVTVAAGTAIFIGPFDPVVYNRTDGGAGQVYVDYSATEGVTVAALLIPL